MGEVLIVDNGSSDNSKLITSNAGVRVVSTSLRGYGNVLRFGIKEVREKYIIYDDCDNGYDFSSLDDYYCMLKEMYVLVNGNFYLGVMEKDSMFFLIVILKFHFYYVYSNHSSKSSEC